VHTLAIKNDGTLWAWGNNAFGQLGDGTTTNRIFPVQVGTDNNWTAIYASSGSYSMAVKSNGTLWAWGQNGFGQLGNGTNTDSNIPVQVGADNDWLIISPGHEYVLATKTNKTLWSWGVNNVAQLGNGSYINSSAPAQVGSDNDWTWVDASFETSMALKSNGSIWAWGNNFNGIFGNGTTGTSSNVPIQVSSTNDWNTFSVSSHVMAKKNDGSLWAWGYNVEGQLGDGTTTDRFSPVQIGTDTDWDTVITGGNFTLGLKNDGTLWHWGNNTFGQYGNGTWFPTSTVPLQNPFYTDWEAISVTDVTAFGIRTGSTLWGWGAGNFGNIGNGTIISSATPAPISCNAVLPLTWLFINAARQNNDALIKWGTASESNTVVFEIEYSTDGYHFIKAGTVNASGNSSTNKSYFYLHNSPSAGINYYRIKQIDANGRYSFSAVVQIKKENSSILFSPNPAKDHLQITLKQSYKKATLKIYTLQGQTVLQQFLPANTLQPVIDITALPAGFYTAQILSGNSSATFKFIKQ
jgi:alpha-tubulin suppressor-like RCC1 family protein